MTLAAKAAAPLLGSLLRGGVLALFLVLFHSPSNVRSRIALPLTG